MIRKVVPEVLIKNNVAIIKGTHPSCKLLFLDTIKTKHHASSGHMILKTKPVDQYCCQQHKRRLRPPSTYPNSVPNCYIIASAMYPQRLGPKMAAWQPGRSIALYGLGGTYIASTVVGLREGKNQRSPNDTQVEGRGYVLYHGG